MIKIKVDPTTIAHWDYGKEKPEANVILNEKIKIDPSKVSPVKFAFKEICQDDFDKMRASGISDEEICRLVQVA